MARRAKTEGPWGGVLASQVRERAKKGWPEGVTVLTGDDVYHLDQAQRCLIDALVPAAERAFGLTVIAAGVIRTGEIVGAVRSSGMFATRRVVLVSDVQVLDGDPEPLEAFAKDPKAGSYLLIRAPRLDRKRKLHQALARTGLLLDFLPPGERDIAEVRREMAGLAGVRNVELDREAADYLLEVCGGDFLRIVSELDKLRDYLGSEPDRCVSSALARRLVSGTEGMSGFEIADALLRRNGPGAMAWARRLVDNGDEPLRILATVAWRSRTMLQGKAMQRAGASAAEVAAAMKAWRYGNELRRLLDGYRLDELLTFPSRLLEADRQMKSRSIGGRAILESLMRDLTARPDREGA